MIPDLCENRNKNLETHYEALDELCPRCGTESGAMCVGTISGEPMKACHWQRVTLAFNRASEATREAS